MKVFSIVGLLILSLVHSSSAQYEEPLVSLDKVTGIVKATAGLGMDSIKYVSFKIEHALSEEHKSVYSDFTRRVVEYRKLVVETYTHSVAKKVVDTVVGTGMGIVFQLYERLNNLNHTYLDGIVEEFEYRFPKSSGLLGQELADRVLTVMWLVFATKTAFKLVFCNKCCRKSKL